MHTEEQLKEARQQQKYEDYQLAGNLLLVEDNELKNNILLLLDQLSDIENICEIEDIDNRTILEEANELIYGDRAQTYGPVTASFTRIAKFWSVILDKEVTAEQVGLCMVALKMSRQLSKSGRDNLVDAAGYFGCIAKMDEERNPQQ